MTIADTNNTATQREKTRSRDFPKQGNSFSKGDKIAEKVVGGYKKVENAVTGGYKKVENAFTGGYKKVEDKFVDKFLRKDGETVEDAKARIEREQAELKAQQEAEAKERAQRARSMSGKLACEFDRTDALGRGREATEKIAKMSGTKTTEQIQSEIKAKYNL